MKRLELTDDEVRALFLLAVYGRPRLTGDHGDREEVVDDVVDKVWELRRSLGTRAAEPTGGGHE